MKRFYKDAAARAADEFWEIHLDGKAMRTPDGAVVGLPTQKAAELLADEWAAQRDEIDLMAMPATRVAYAAIDYAEDRRADWEKRIISYAETDALRHWAERPTELVRRQADQWRPMLDWLREAHEMTLEPQTGIIAEDIDETSKTALRHHLASLDLWPLTTLHELIGLLGSTTLGLAIAAGRLTAHEATALSRLEEEFQIEQWGEDSEAKCAADRRASHIASLALFLHALSSDQT